jgi:hypothetical protein
VCAPACADTCGKPKLLDRLRGLFNKHDCGCDTGCGGCGGAPIGGPGGPVNVPPAGTPDKMPNPMPKPTTIGSTGTVISPAKIGIEDVKNPF